MTERRSCNIIFAYTNELSKTKYPKITNRKIYKFNKRKLRVQCLLKFLVFISFPLCIDIRVGFKTYCQFEHKRFFSCSDKKKIWAEHINSNYARRVKAWYVNIKGRTNNELRGSLKSRRATGKNFSTYLSSQ